MAVKTVQGVAEASVKTVLGVANASVKTIMGVSMSGGGGGIAVVSSVATGGNSTGVTSSAIDSTGANLIVLSVSSFAANAQPTVSDSKSNTWTALTAYQDGAGVERVRLYYCYSPTVGSGHTFTASGTDSYAAIAAIAFSGTATPVGPSNGAGAATTATQQPGSVTPGGDNMVVVTGLNFNTGSPASISAPFTIAAQAAPVGGSSFGTAIAHDIQTSATARNPTWTIGNAGDGMAAAIAVFA